MDAEPEKSRNIVSVGELSTPEIISFAAGSVIRHINSSENVDERRLRAVQAVRELNTMWDMTGGEREVMIWDAQFRGYLPERPLGKSIVTGSIMGVAKKFEPYIFNNVNNGVMARYLIMLTIYDAKGVVNIADKSYRYDGGKIEYQVDLAHSIGPFEEVA